MPTKIRGKGKKATRKTAKDPVCGMNVDPESALKHVDQGKETFFCSEECRQKFEQNPSGYQTL